MNRTRKTASELEDIIRSELADICELPAGEVSVVPDGPSWRVLVRRPIRDARHREAIGLVGDRLRAQFDLVP